MNFKIFIFTFVSLCCLGITYSTLVNNKTSDVATSGAETNTQGPNNGNPVTVNVIESKTSISPLVTSSTNRTVKINGTTAASPVVNDSSKDSKVATNDTSPIAPKDKNTIPATNGTGPISNTNTTTNANNQTNGNVQPSGEAVVTPAPNNGTIISTPAGNGTIISTPAGNGTIVSPVPGNKSSVVPTNNETTAPTPLSTSTVTPTSVINSTTSVSTHNTASGDLPDIHPTTHEAVNISPSVRERQFDGPSFFGGSVLVTGLGAIGFVAYKFYKSRETELNYRTL